MSKEKLYISFIKWISIGYIFILTLLGIFLPYNIELLFGLNIIGLTSFSVSIFLNRKEYQKWRLIIEVISLSLIFIFSLIFIIWKIYAFYFINQGLSLLFISYSFIYTLIRVNKEKSGKKIIKNITLVVASIISITVFSLGSISLLGYKRSLMSSLVELALANTKVDDSHALEAFNRDTSLEKELTFDTSLVKNDIRMELFENMKVYYLNSNSNYSSVLFYIHGGYYIYNIDSYQIKSIDRIATLSNSMVVIPLYTLAPFEDVDINYPRMKRLYEKVVADNPNKKISLLGDSAGGGFALSIAENLTKSPDELILLSPWVDVTMTNPDIKQYYDPTLSITMCKLCGEAWAGTNLTNDYRVSPIYGDLSKLNKVTIFVGTRELFYPDNILLYNKIKETGNPHVSLIVGNGLNHVYPFGPTIEGRFAIEQISRIINS